MVSTEVPAGGTYRNVFNIFVAPAEAFAQLKERPTFLVPLVALIAGYQCWTGTSLASSAAIVAGPLLVIVAIVLAVAL